MLSFLNRWLCTVGLMACSFMVPAGQLTVSAAASLTDAFKEIGRAFEVQHPDTDVRFNFGASDALVQQLAAGAPIDLLATADQDSMDKAAAQKLIEPATRTNFARNTLVAIVPADREVVPQGLPDLERDDITRIALGNPASVPAGRYARDALERGGRWPAIEAKAIYTQNVRQALDYVARAEVDVAFVYATDAAIRKDQVRVAFPLATEVPITYPIAVIAGKSAEARRFLDYVLSPPGQASLAGYGFLPP
ncbi:MAG: molybdate ABC transporter substrate-binding protein [Gammaproteobacteria bacterium]|nr:molybdate ABC transporter substrate-binding protein [Gammaproteobacteria bacterium]